MKSRKFVFTAFALSSPILVLTAVLCVTSASRGGPRPKGQVPPASPALIAQGKAIYGTLDCYTCHTIGGAGTAVGPDLTVVGKTWMAARLKTMIRHPRLISPKGYMPEYAKTKINSVQLTALAAYLASLK